MNLTHSIITSFLFSILAVSCTPSKLMVKSTSDNEIKITKTEYVGIINDVCLQYDPMFKKDYVLLDDSKLAASFMSAEAKRKLEEKGYTVSYTASPFVGCFKPSDTRFRLANERKGEIEMVNPPFYVDDSDSISEHYLNAVLMVLNEVYYTMLEGNKPVFSTTPELRASLDTIATYTGQHRILFMVGSGTIVPIGKSIVKGLTIGLATSILTMGTFIMYAFDVSYLNSYLMLIDLTSGEMLWSNQMRLTEYNADKEEFYTNLWSKNLLFHYPPREGVVMKK